MTMPAGLGTGARAANSGTAVLLPSLLTLLRTCKLAAEGVRGMKWDLPSPASAVGMASAVVPSLQSSWRLCQ